MGELPQGFAPPVVGTRLIVDPDDARSFTANQETDARSALTRGLAEYVSTLSYEDIGGRTLQFNRVFSTWPDTEEEAVYPSALVRADSPGDYESSHMTPAVSSNAKLMVPDGRYVVSPCEFAIDLILELRATDPDARKALCAMLEDALNPVDYRYGVLLELPHYFNQRATFELASMAYIDAQDQAMERVRIAEFTLRGRVPVTRLSKLPLAQFRTRIDEVAPDAGVIKGVTGKRTC